MTTKESPQLDELEYEILSSGLLSFDMEDSWKTELDSLIAKYGKKLVEDWRDTKTKHHHAFIHLATCKNFKNFAKTSKNFANSPNYLESP